MFKLLLTLVVATTGFASELPFELQRARLSGAGKIHFVTSDGLKAVKAKISVDRDNKIRVEIGGRVNKSSDVKLTTKDGRRFVTVKFNNPASLGRCTQAMLHGTFVQEGNRAIFYGDLFTVQRWQPWEGNIWQYRGGFFFQTR